MAITSETHELRGRQNAELFDYVDSSRTDEETFHFLGFEFLHRLNITGIQNDLIEIKEDVFGTRGGDCDKEKLSRLLNEYTTAIRNYNYIHEAHRLDYHTTERRKQRLKYKFQSMTTSYRHTRPFESHYYYLHDNARHPMPDVLRDKLRRWLPLRLSYSSQERRYRSKEFDEGKPPDEISPLVDNLVRLSVALVAVLVLAVPICIISVQPSLTKSLVTSIIFMVLFACALSFGVKSSNIETLVATATYSAVLVVFIGTNTQASTT
ncbi:hypothetical protein M434DRAFT_16063 [Hypoxylon sp. CO27-5]|nr:hypothetical protein M434DRAFT_16063 [Hypoxylon sp. CO27-5]